MNPVDNQEFPLTAKEASGIFYKLCESKWNTRYLESPSGVNFKIIQPSIFRTADVSQMSRKYERLIFRLQTGHCGLRSHLHRTGKTDFAMCNNCSTEEAVSHFVLQCPVYEQERSQLKLKASELGIQFELCTILGDP